MTHGHTLEIGVVSERELVYFRSVPLQIIISATSDLLSDQRVHRTASALKEDGHKILVIGRKLRNSPELPARRYRCFRMRLPVERGPLFYLIFNLKLAWMLFWSKADVLFSNDLDTLAANYLVSRLRNIPLVYDSHEYFTGVPELANRPRVKMVWKWLERRIVPHLKHCITVNASIAKLYFDEYSVPFKVIRNVPEPITIALPERGILRKSLGLPIDKPILILQGAGINIQRGAEEAVESMKLLSDYLLLIVGSGDVIPQLKQTVLDEGLSDRIRFIDRMPPSELKRFTAAADIGLSLDKDTNINYRFSLPNKLFDYLHAGIPVVASNLPEVAAVVTQYQVGQVIANHTPDHIAQCVREVYKGLENGIYKAGIEKACNELNWNEERKQLLQMIKSLA
jgi:glycosyltransferase involved in cell wall biosynthesis